MQRWSVACLLFVCGCGGAPGSQPDAMTCPDPGADLTVSAPVRVLTGARTSASVSAVTVAENDVGGLAVVVDQDGSVVARRLALGGAPVDDAEKIDVSGGAVGATGAVASARASGGFLVIWTGTSAGAALLDAAGSVAHRTALMPSGAIAGAQIVSVPIIAGQSEPAGVVLRECNVTECVLVRREIAADGSVSSAVELLRIAVAVSIAGAVHANGGLLAWTEGTTLRGIDLTGAAEAIGAPRDLVTDPALPAGVVGVAATSGGGGTALVCSGRDCALAVGQAGGPSTLTAVTSLSFLPAGIAALTDGYVVAGVDATGGGFGTRVAMVRFDAAGVGGAADELGQAVWPDTSWGAAALDSYSGSEVLVAWLILDPSSLPTTLHATGVSGTTVATTESWRLDAHRPVSGFDTATGGAGTYVIADATARRITEAGIQQGNDFPLPGAWTEGGPAPFQVVVADDAAWMVAADLEGDTTLAVLDPGGATVATHQLGPRSPGVQHVEAAWTGNGGVVVAGDWLVRVDNQGAPLGTALPFNTVATVRRLFGSDDGEALLLFVQPTLEAVRIEQDGSARGMYLDGTVAYAAQVQAWSCGGTCWMIFAGDKVWQWSDDTLAEVEMPDGATAIGAAADGCDALVAMRTGTGALSLARVAGAGASHIDPATPVPISAEDGVAVSALGDRRFLVTVAGHDPTSPDAPGVFAIPVELP